MQGHNSSSQEIRNNGEQFFITNPQQFGSRFYRPRPQIIPVVQECQDELTELKKKYEELMEVCKGIHVQEVASQYRELGRKYKQIRMTGESELSKIQAISQIDFNFMKKSWSNEPKIPFAFLDRQVAEMCVEQEVSEKRVKILAKAVLNLQYQVG